MKLRTDRVPDRVTLRVCPHCGRTDRYTAMNWRGHRPAAGTDSGPRGMCPGIAIEVEYRRAAA